MQEAFEFLRQGGWPMIPLGICSVAAVTIIIERAFALRRSKVINPYVADQVQTVDVDTALEAVMHVCRRSNGSFARIVEDVITARHLDRPHVVETMESTGRKELGHLERGLIILEIVAGISPLIGLLGTVLGMVTVFDAITAEGIGNPQVLSAGISEALVTTITGLAIAIPSLAFHSFFSRRVESFGIEMQDLATRFIAKLQTRSDDASHERYAVRKAAPHAE